MSLIVATSRIDENTLPQDSEKPSNFKNFYRSPIEIEPDSEIAVQSVKIQRTGNITVGDNDFFCHYFGLDPLDVDSKRKLTSVSRMIKIPKGTYSATGYEKAIKDALNVQYDDPRTFGGYNVGIQTDATGVEKGLEIVCTDKGSASGKDLYASMVAVPAYNIAGPASYFGLQQIEKSDEFTWTSGAGTFVSELDNTTLNTARSIGLLTGFPFGLNEGKFDITLDACQDNPFCVGLSRPQIQVESYRNSTDTQTIHERWENIHNLDKYTGPHTYHDTRIENYTGTETINGPWETYDYVFIRDENDEITIAQRVYGRDDMADEYETEEVPPFSYLQELNYWQNAYPSSPGAAKLTRAQFYTTWDGIRFEGFGDEIRLYFKQKGKAAYDLVLSSTYDSGKVGTCFSPIGTTSNALYPMLNIGKGTATITKMESSNTLSQYKYPAFTDTATGVYVAGNDAFSNEGFYYLPRGSALGDVKDPWIKVSVPDAISSNSISSLVLEADTSIYKSRAAFLDIGNYVFSLLNAAKGVDFVHLFTMNKFIPGVRLDTLINSQKFPCMSGRLGFVDRAFIISNDNDGYVAGDGTLAVTFKSTGEIQKTSTSSFIRVPNLTHKSFNGAQSGLSKILYQLPQFANDGRQFGPLYFEPGEKTYVKLNNTAPMILNHLQVQIVDAQEREMNSLIGDTQVVFHVRKHR